MGNFSARNADLPHAATTQPIHPPHRPVALAKLDQRTKEARLMRETRAELVAHVGGNPSAVQAAMIERACQLTLRIVAMDRKFAETGAQTDHDSRTYLAWSNSLSGHVFLPCAHALLLDISIIQSVGQHCGQRRIRRRRRRQIAPQPRRQPDQSVDSRSTVPSIRAGSPVWSPAGLPPAQASDRTFSRARTRYY
jgi:hypothetical protein